MQRLLKSGISVIACLFVALVMILISHQSPNIIVYPAIRSKITVFKPGEDNVKCNNGTLDTWDAGFDKARKLMNFNEIRQMAVLMGENNSRFSVKSDVLTLHELMKAKGNKLFDKNLRKIGHNSTKYKHAFKIETDNGIFVQITETLQKSGNLSKGGSNFKILCRDDIRLYNCDLTDNFNGTYFSTCPKLPVTGTLNLLIQLQFVDFYAYFRTSEWEFNKTIFTQDISKKDIKFDRFDYQPHWRKYNNTYRWTIGDCHIPDYESEGISKGFQKYDKVQFIGDSHTRYMFYYVKMMLGKLSSKLERKEYRDIGGNHISYAFKTNSKPIVKHLEALRQKITEEKAQHNSTSRLLILNTGQWDLAYAEPIAGYFANLHNMSKVMKDLVDLGVRIIWFAIPPYPRMHYEKVERRNSYIISAANDYANSKFEQTGIDIVDTFPMMYTRYREGMGVHYLSVDPKKIKPRKEYAQVGLEFANFLIHMVLMKS